MQKSINYLAILGLLAISTCSNGSVLNGGFESGSLSDWTLMGQGTVKTASFGVVPPFGTYQGYIDNTGNFTQLAGPVCAFLGIDASDITGLMSGTPTRGSAIKQTITTVPYEILTFEFNFLSDEYDEAAMFNDFAFLTVDNDAYFLASRYTTFPTANFVSPPAGFDGQSNYSTFNFTFLTGGVHEIGFGIFNVGDTGHNSALLLDQIQVIAPEPATLGLAGMASAVALRRRNNQSRCKR